MVGWAPIFFVFHFHWLNFNLYFVQMKKKARHKQIVGPERFDLGAKRTSSKRIVCSHERQQAQSRQKSNGLDVE